MADSKQQHLINDYRINSADIDGFDKRYRTHFINSLSGFKSANLVGTISAAGVPNLAIVNSVFHLGAAPPLMGMITRSNSVRRDTAENIKQTGYFTLNHVNRHIYQQAHQTSARYAAEVNEFEAVGLTEEYSETIPAPYVAESAIRIGLKVEEVKPIEINKTEFIIGRIVEITAPKDCVENDGYINVEAAGTICVSSLDAYHQTSRIDRLSYAKPDLPLSSLN